MSYISERLELICSALEFMDKQAQLKSIRDQAAEFDSRKDCLVYNFNITLDLALAIEHDATLGNSILSHPVESSSIFQEIILQFCQNEQLVPVSTTPTQICARIRVVNFPSGFHSLQISSIADLNKCIDFPGFVLLTGIVVGISGPAKYTQSTKYLCPEEACEGHYGNHYIRMHSPGASETQTIRNDFRCTFCGNILNEDTPSRILSDKVLIEIAPVTLKGTVQREIFTSRYNQSIPVFVRDELIDCVTLGETYQVVGITRTDMSGESIEVTLELERIMANDVSLIPTSVKTIYEATSRSPWSFPLNIAYRFGDQIVPGGCMIKLRLLILISLVLNPKKCHFHILSLGKDTHLIQSLYRYAETFSQRSFNVMMGTPLCGKVSGEGSYVWAPYFIQAGVLPLCSSGVCICGDLSPWKKQNKEQLQAILSGSRIFLDLASKHTGGLSQQLTFDLQCQVWATYSPEVTKGRRDDILCGSSTGDLSKSFLDSFSYICFLDAGCSSVEEEIQTQLCYHNLASWVAFENSDNNRPDLTHENIQTYISFARQLEPELTVEAESLIQSYHAAIRVARSSGLSGSAVPASGVASLLSLATGFAKLRLSNLVEDSDALMAVYLYEESLVARFGVSILNIHPQPHISDACIADFLGEQNDVEMQRFQSQLLKFCSRTYESRSTFKEE